MSVPQYPSLLFTYSNHTKTLSARRVDLEQSLGADIHWFAPATSSSPLSRINIKSERTEKVHTFLFNKMIWSPTDRAFTHYEFTDGDGLNVRVEI